MRERIRARFFPKLPGAVLFFIPEGLRLEVKGLGAPFGREEIAQTCGDVQISEAEPGRWTSSIRMARSAAKAECRQRQNEQMATQAAVLRGSVDPRERDRAKLALEKQQADARTRELKIAISAAKTQAATTGQYMDPRKYRSLERDLEQAKQKSQALQAQLGKLREAEKAEILVQQARFERAFVKAARELLQDDDFAELKARAEEILEDMTAEAEERRTAAGG